MPGSFRIRKSLRAGYPNRGWHPADVNASASRASTVRRQVWQASCGQSQSIRGILLPPVYLKHSLFILKHGSLWTYRLATYAVLAAGIVFVALVIGLRYVVLPNINDYREAIAQAVSR